MLLIRSFLRETYGSIGWMQKCKLYKINKNNIYNEILFNLVINKYKFLQLIKSSVKNITAFTRSNISVCLWLDHYDIPTFLIDYTLP